MIDPNMWYMLMGNQQYGQQGGQQQQPQQQNQWMSGLGGFMGPLGEYFAGADQRKMDKWDFNQRKAFHDRLVYGGEANKPAVSPQMLAMMLNRNRDALGPTRRGMSHAASRFGGPSSGQMWKLFDQNYSGVEAGLANQNQQWATGINEQRWQFIKNLIARSLKV